MSASSHRDSPGHRPDFRGKLIDRALPTSLVIRGAVAFAAVLLSAVAVVGICTAAAAVTSPDAVPTTAATTAVPSEPTPTERPTAEQTTPTESATTTATPTPTALSSPGDATQSSPGDVVPTSTNGLPTSPVDTPTATAVPQPATRPAVQESGISLTTAALAILALVVAGSALVVLHHVDRGSPDTVTTPPAVSRPTGDDTAATAALLVDLGEAMIDAGYTVSQTQTTLQRVLEVSGILDGEVLVLPTAVFVSVPGQARMETAVAAVGLSRLRLDQVEDVSRIVTAAEAGAITPTDARAALARIRTQAPPFGPVERTLGAALFSAGLALILSGGAADVIVAAALGAVVGAIQIALADSGAATRAVLPVLCAFLASTAVFLLGRLSEDIGVLAPLVAPLVTLLPGALLTTAVVELSTGQMISGAGRLAAGLLQLALLALGILAGAELVGVTSIGSMERGALGDFGPWLGVALFGTGVLVHHCARASSFGWILLVLYVAYGAQIIGGLFLGPLLSAFVGALVMSPVASYIALRPTGPPTQVSFLPAFWLLVPGALGLVGLTQLLGNNQAEALASLLSMGTTMIGISFGVLIGLAIGTAISRRVAREPLLESARTDDELR